MKRRMLLVLMCALAAMSCEPPVVVEANDALVRFTCTHFEQRKFAIGAAVDDFLLDTGFRPNGSLTGFYAIPEGTHIVFDFSAEDGPWRVLEAGCLFEARRRYEVAGIGMEAYEIRELP